MPKHFRFLAAIFFAFLFVSTAFPQTWPAFILYQKNGAAFNDFLGFSVASAGDVNGDGVPDFIIGAFGADPGGLSLAGSAYVYSGADGSLLYQKNGAAAGDNFGQSVAGAGDVNGDGRADFIIGAYLADPGGLTDAGSAYVYSGADGMLLFPKNGAVAGDQLGNSVASAGDVNGDGRADFIIGANSADPGGLGNAGSAYVYSGATGALLFQKNGAAAGDLLGKSVASAGDVNGDGRADFIVGANGANPLGLGDAGSAFIYSGATGGLLYQKDGAAASDQLGYSVAGAGDVNGDGRADFIVGAYGANPGGLGDAGSAFIYTGATGGLLYQKNGAAFSDNLGLSVASAGDVNGDGRADFIIGALGAAISFAGSAFIYSGADGALLFQKNGAAAGDQLGNSVASAGDVNRDGRADFIIGAWGADPGGLGSAGSAFLFHSGYNEDIQSITDVGNDQGKQARLRWKSLPGGNPFVNQFVVFRRIDGALAASHANVFSGAGFPPGNWEQAAIFAAFGDTIYNGIVPTLVDSTSSGITYSVFFVRAASDDPTIHFDSPVDSGYSMDNLVPAAPSILAAVGTCQSTVNLNYSAPVDEDFQYFKIYRDVSPSFTNPVVAGNTIDSFFVDAVPAGQTFYYRVSAVDFSGNEGQSPQANALAGLKGDLNIDAILTAADVVVLLNTTFLGSPFSAPFCAADVNCDGILTSADVVIELNLVFLGTPVVCAP